MAERLGLEAVFDTQGFAQAIAAYNSGLQGAVSQTNAAGQAMGGVGERLRGLGGAFQVALGNLASSAITGALGLISQGISGITSSFINGNAEFERYQVQFGVLLGSADAAKERLADLAKFGATTPFELPEVVRANKILQAFGLQSEDTAKRFGMSGKEIMTIAGDTAAGTGASFEEISTYLGKFSSGATGEAISRMQELGIVTRAQLTDMGLQFGKSGELLSPLDKSMTVLLQAMKTKFGGMMDAQSQTFEGMLSNLQDWLGQTGRELGKPIFDVVKKSLGGLLSFLGSDTVKGALSGFATTLAGGLENAINTVSGIVERFGPIIGNIIKQLTSPDWTRVFTVFEDGSGAFSDFLQALGVGEGVAITVSQALSHLAQGVEILFKIISGAPWDESMSALTKGFTDAFGPGATDLLFSFSAIISGTVKAVQQLLAGDLTGAVTTFVDFFVGAVGDVDEEWSGMGDTVNLAVGYVETALNNMLTIVTTIFNGLVALVQPTLELLSTTIGTVFTAITTAVSEHGAAIQSNLSNAWTAVVATVGPVVNSIVAIVTTVFKTISSFLQEHGTEISAFIGTAWEKISSIISGVAQVIQAIVVPVFTAITNFVIENQDGLKAAIDLVWGAIRLIVETALNLLSGIVNLALAVLKGDWEGAWNVIKDTVNNVWNSIVTFFNGVPAQMVAMGKQAIEGLIRGINSQADAVLNALRGIIDGALNNIKNFLGIHSPSRVFMNFGELMMAGLTQGLYNGASDAQGALEQIMARLSHTANAGAFAALQGDILNGLGMNTDLLRTNQADMLSSLQQQLQAGTLSDITLARSGQTFAAQNDLISQLVNLAERVSNLTFSPQTGDVMGPTATINMYFSGSPDAQVVESGVMRGLRRAGMTVAN